MDVAVPQWAYYHSPLHFADPDRFAPHRWIDAEGTSQSPSDTSEMDLAFGVGSRDCIGRYLAWMQMRVILSRLLWNFDIAPISNMEWDKQKTYIMWEKKPFWIQISSARGLNE